MNRLRRILRAVTVSDWAVLLHFAVTAPLVTMWLAWALGLTDATR